jgi:hypothetical protein
MPRRSITLSFYVVFLTLLAWPETSDSRLVRPSAGRQSSTMAFNAKNLQYDKNEPAFLRRLKGQFSGLDGRHNVQIARPKKDRLNTADDDDDPVIVDESGETIGKDDFETRMNGGDRKMDGNEKEGAAAGLVGVGEVLEGDGVKPAAKQTTAEIGLSKKRKAVKVIGEEVGEAEDAKAATGKDNKSSDQADSGANTMQKKEAGTTQKKGKKIKLSFDEPED